MIKASKNHEIWYTYIQLDALQHFWIAVDLVTNGNRRCFELPKHNVGS